MEHFDFSARRDEPAEATSLPGARNPSVDESRHRIYRRFGKRAFDYAGGPLLLLALSPVIAIVGVLVRLRLGSPIFYMQERVGLNGKPFLMYKFRTMRPDRRTVQVAPSGPDRRHRHKTADDPRHTPFGTFLRKHSLDELPQLLNVVKGDMSLVGPRPELTAIVARYEPWQHERHRVKPGLTGLWQVSLRNLGDGSLMYQHTDTDIEYINQISLASDVRIILDTFRVLVTSGGGGE